MMKRVNRIIAFPEHKDEEWMEDFMNSKLFSEEEKLFVLFNIDEVKAWTLDDFELKFKDIDNISIYEKLEITKRKGVLPHDAYYKHIWIM